MSNWIDVEKKIKVHKEIGNDLAVLKSILTARLNKAEEAFKEKRNRELWNEFIRRYQI